MHRHPNNTQVRCHVNSYTPKIMGTPSCGIPLESSSKSLPANGRHASIVPGTRRPPDQVLSTTLDLWTGSILLQTRSWLRNCCIPESSHSWPSALLAFHSLYIAVHGVLTFPKICGLHGAYTYFCDNGIAKAELVSYNSEFIFPMVNAVT